MRSRDVRWQWSQTFLTPEQIKLLKPGELPDRIMLNDLYEVWMRRINMTKKGWPDLWWLSIKSRDRDVIRDWRHLQRIKNELVGRENEGVEVFPAESRKVDTCNQFHLWVIADPDFRLPFGYVGRSVMDTNQAAQEGAKQRPFEDEGDA